MVRPPKYALAAAGVWDPSGRGGRAARYGSGMAVVVWGAGFGRFSRLAFLLRPGRP